MSKQKRTDCEDCPALSVAYRKDMDGLLKMRSSGNLRHLSKENMTASSFLVETSERAYVALAKLLDAYDAECEYDMVIAVQELTGLLNIMYSINVKKWQKELREKRNQGE